LFKTYPPSLAVMEGYSINSTNRKFLLGEIGSVVKITLLDAGARRYEAAPTQLKKFVTGKGSASKDDVIRSVNALWGVGVTDDNLADAYGLARIGVELLSPSTQIRSQLDVLNALTGAIKRKKKKVTKFKRTEDL